MTPAQQLALNTVAAFYEAKIEAGLLPPEAWPFVHWTPLYQHGHESCECGVVWVMVSGAN